MYLDKDYWDNRYKNSETGWNVGYPTTPLVEYINQISDKEIKILIPGSGNGYEAEYLFKKNFSNIYVLDYSVTALENFINRVPDFPRNNIIEKNFFDFHLTPEYFILTITCGVLSVLIIGITLEIF